MNATYWEDKDSIEIQTSIGDFGFANLENLMKDEDFWLYTEENENYMFNIWKVEDENNWMVQMYPQPFVDNILEFCFLDII